MQAITLQQRILEFQREYELSRRMLDFANGKVGDIFMLTVERLAQENGLFPFVFYRQKDHKLEDLGFPIQDLVFDNYFGRVLTRYMNDRTQEAFASFLETSPANLSRYQKGKIMPKASEFQRISGLLGLVPFYLPKPSEVMPLSAESPIVISAK